MVALGTTAAVALVAVVVDGWKLLDYALYIRRNVGDSSIHCPEKKRRTCIKEPTLQKSGRV